MEDIIGAAVGAINFGQELVVQYTGNRVSKQTQNQPGNKGVLTVPGTGPQTPERGGTGPQTLTVSPGGRERFRGGGSLSSRVQQRLQRLSTAAAQVRAASRTATLVTKRRRYKTKTGRVYKTSQAWRNLKYSHISRGL